MNENPNLAAALEYANRGWHVFPVYEVVTTGGEMQCSCKDGAACGSPGKHPRTPSGLNDATTDKNIIRAWWKRWPAASVAIRTGEISGVVAIDLDGSDGLLEWERLTAEHGPAETLTARTGSGGRHLFFAHPGLPIKTRTKILPSVDVRGDGGYVVAAPSNHISGSAYEWLNAIPVAFMPAFVLNTLLGAGESSAPIESLPLSPDLTLSSANTSKYVEAALRGELDRMRSAGEGTRNNTLNRCAFSLGQLVGAGLLAEADAVGGLTDAARAVGLDESEIIKTIASGLRGGMAQPRTLPAPTRTTSAAPPAPRVGEAADVHAPEVQDFLYSAPQTDAGNGECLVAMRGGNMRFVNKLGKDGKWATWNGAKWRIDEDGAAMRAILLTARERRDAATRAMNTTDKVKQEQAAKLQGFALRSENTNARRNALTAASTDARVASVITDYDRDPMLAIAGDRRINLRDLAVTTPDPSDLITMSLGTAYDALAPTPTRWIAFLHEVWPDKAAVHAYIQRAFGYSLTGDTREHMFFLCTGGGRNGKSTLLNTGRKLAGDYGTSTAFATFDSDNRDSNSNGLAALKGKRFVTLSETNEDRRLDEAKVKSVTGGDEIQCRFLFAEYFGYKPQFKLWMAVNHLPIITGTDNGVWSRIHLIRFDQSFLGREDKTLEGTLDRELPGILNWAIEGLRSWHEQGLNPPPEIKKATNEYRADSDICAQWMADDLHADPAAILYSTAAFPRYRIWAENQGIRQPWSQNKLTARLKEKVADNGRDGRKGTWFKGWGLNVNVDLGAA